MAGTVGHDQEFVSGMEGHQITEFWVGGQEFPPALKDEDAFDEIFPEDGIVQPPLLFHRQEGKSP